MFRTAFSFGNNMRIVLHEFLNDRGQVAASEVIHTDIAPWNTVTHPTQPGVQLPMHVFLGMCDGDDTLRINAGYHAPSIVLGRPVGGRKWDRIFEATQHPDAEAHFKA